MSSLAWGMTLGCTISSTPMAPGTLAGGYLTVDATGMALAVADEDLVNQVVIFRNKDAFSVLVERYKGAIFNLIYRTIGSSPEAEDLAQEVFFQVYRSLPAFRNEARFFTWLYRIALHRCRDWIRDRRRRPQSRYSGEAADEGLCNVALENVEAGNAGYAHLRQPGASIEDEVVEKEQREAVRSLVRALPDKYREVVVLRYFQDLTYVDIGEILGLPARTVETRLYRAKKMLKDKLENRLEKGGYGYDQ